MMVHLRDMSHNINNDVHDMSHNINNDVSFMSQYKHSVHDMSRNINNDVYMVWVPQIVMPISSYLFVQTKMHYYSCEIGIVGNQF